MCVCNPKIRSPWCKNCEPVPSRMPKCKTPKVDNEALTKREDIAKHLMASIIQGGAISEIGNEHWYAERACNFADALLKELEK